MKPIPIFPDFEGTRRFTVYEYHRLGDAGILGPEDNVELLDGYIMSKADYPELQPANPPFPKWRWLRRFTLAEYLTMMDVGNIRRDVKIEFVEGYLGMT